MSRLIHVKNEGLDSAACALRRSPLDLDSEIYGTVRQIGEDVQFSRDSALVELGRRFDCPTLNSIPVSDSERDSAEAKVHPETRDSLEAAAENIRAFHQRQKKDSWRVEEDGRLTGQLIRPLGRVGIYVPGGTAVYPSSVLMTAIPARAAGVNEIVMCTPCGRDGSVHPLVLVAARIAGVNRIFKVGGAQAIFAMAYGTESVPAVDKIVGPGNVYVNAAKKLVWGQVDVDMLAGPSEVCVLADESANPAFVAADMLTQAEHDTESAAFLITASQSLAESVAREIETQLLSLPRREILRKALENSAIIVTESLEQAVELANICAPEHLALMVRNPESLLPQITNAGAILMGDFSPQTLGDYFAGPSHTLPTNGTARFSSPINVDTFLKKTSIISYTEAALRDASVHLLRLARAEGFEAHAAAVEQRLKENAS